MTDIASWIRGTQRHLTRAGDGDTRVLTMRRRYDADIDDVWDACTNPDRIPRWFLPVSGDLRPGGTFHLEGNASGEILRCEPPRLLNLTWGIGGYTSEVRLLLAPGGDGATILDLEHAPVPATIDLAGRQVDPVLNDAATGMWGLGSGWEMGLYGLDRYLSGDFDATTLDLTAQFPPELLELADRAGHGWAHTVRGPRDNDS